MHAKLWNDREGEDEAEELKIMSLLNTGQHGKFTLQQLCVFLHVNVI